MKRKLTFIGLVCLILLFEACSEGAAQKEVSKKNLEYYESLPEASGEIMLVWKFEGGNSLKYQFNEIEIDVEKEDGEGLLYEDLTSELLQTKLASLKEFSNSIRKDFVLSPIESGLIDVELEVVRVDEVSEELIGIGLRGQLSTQGEITSFWVKEAQMNLLSLMFELPHGTVSKGDSWSLDNVRLINLGEEFKCDGGTKEGSVSLVGVKVDEGDTLAVLYYDFQEEVNGVFVGVDSSNATESMKILMRYKGEAVFSVNRGSWLFYDGLMSQRLTGGDQDFDKYYELLIE